MIAWLLDTWQMAHRIRNLEAVRAVPVRSTGLLGQKREVIQSQCTAGRGPSHDYFEVN